MQGPSVNSALVGRIVQLIVLILGLVAAVLIGRMVAKEQYQLMAGIAAVGFVFTLYFAFGRYIWMVCFASIFLEGGFPFLPLGLRPFEILLIGGVCHFALDSIIFRKRPPALGPPVEGWLIILSMLVILYHAAHDRLGVRMLGSDIWGGRAYLGIIFAAAAYFCLQGHRLEAKQWRWLPLIILIVGAISFSINLVSLLSPRIGDLISRFYTGVYLDDPTATFSRFGFLGQIGYILVLWVLSRTKVFDFLPRKRIFSLAFFVVGVGCCLSSGYRSSLVFGFVIVLIACIRDLRWFSVVIVILGIAFLGGVSYFNSSIHRLPPGVQRGLVAIPGDWDPDLIQSAEGSDEFRWSVWAYWTKYYFPLHPVLGRGLGVPFSDIMSSIATTTGVDQETGENISSYEDRDDSFATTGNLHNGFLSVLDRFGVVGGLFIFSLIIVALKRFFSFLLHTKVSPETASLHWLALYGATYIICYPWGALRIDDMLPVLFLTLGLFNALKTSSLDPGKTPPLSVEPMATSSFPNRTLAEG